ncbi:hypothetical protein PI124_g12508 [Phytophthora idaei]|nr:hypothetical protein PI125_g12071 [Phytophthora idaei]KAG3151936.1 hypothetical protein PI126_g10782 [Phytophthora idaei]KAG3242676.1 hypothetical protein PI124_g12508 [Phytophthora idaei]
MPAAEPTAGAAAANAASSSTSRPSKGKKPRKHAAPAIKNRAMASPKKRKTPAHSSGKKSSSASDANPLTLVIITSAKSEVRAAIKAVLHKVRDQSTIPWRLA